MDIKDLEGLSVVTEQGMFGDLNVKDPNDRKLKKKKKEDESSDDVTVED